MKKLLYPITLNKYFLISSVFISLFLLGLLSYNFIFINKIFPNIYIAGINVSNLKKNEVSNLLSEKIKVPETVKLVSLSETFDLNVKDIDLTYDFQKSAVRAFDLTRSGNILSDFCVRLTLPFKKREIGLSTKLNEENLNKFISSISDQISVDPIYPSASFENKKLIINKGQKGTTLDIKLLRARIGSALSLADSANIQIPTQEVDPTLNQKEEEIFALLANKYQGKSIEAKLEFNSFKFSDNQILSFLNPKGGFNEENIKEEIFKIAQKENRDPQEPKFNFVSDGQSINGKVSEFQPAKDGITVDSDKFLLTFKENLKILENFNDKIITFDIPTTKKSPRITTDKVNNLGIKELIGRGTSTYFHSIPGRVHNVSLAATRINGILVSPGETFSFNKALGDVSKFTGYKEAYVIQNGRTVLGDGGGVCQVSTTLFRSVLNAGLPIEERRAHAYRVGYYEQDSPPGIDATVFDPSPDFKFRNDTPAHILITAKADPKKYTLVFELYGTSDGRVSTITKPVVTGVTPPPPDLYQDDPTLPVGTLKQVDYKAWGAKVSFNYSVTKEGEEIYKKTFISNYRPWQSVYLKGTMPTQ